MTTGAPAASPARSKGVKACDESKTVSVMEQGFLFLLLHCVAENWQDLLCTFGG
jgi:hypothetical protein